MLHKISLLVGLSMLCLQGCGAGDPSSFLDELELPDLGWGGDGGDYQGLEVPPDLDIPEKKGDYDVVSMRDADTVASRVLPRRFDMRLRSEGNVTWLTVGVAPDTLWTHLIDFWRSHGFELAEENMLRGRIATVWREQRLDASVGIHTRDLFRMRMEREPDAVTNIYLANRKARFLNGNWQVVFGDQETEVEILQDLADYLSAGSGGAVRLPPLERVNTELDVRNLRGVPVLTVGQPYSSVWRRLGVMLDRAGLDVRRADRSRGVYLIEYDEDSSAASQPAASGRNLRRRQLLQIHLLSKSDKTLVTVHGNYKNGPALDYQLAHEVLQRIVQSYRVRV